MADKISHFAVGLLCYVPGHMNGNEAYTKIKSLPASLPLKGLVA